MQPFAQRLQQYVVVGVLPLMAVLFWSGSADPVNVPKMTAAAFLAVAAATAGLLRVVAIRRLVVPAPPVAALALGLLGALVLGTLLSDVPAMSVAGTFGRSDGLLLYASCLLLFLVTFSAFGQRELRWLIGSLLAGGAVASCYGLLQEVRVDPIAWADVGISPVIGTFGNPDFESAYMGIVVPAALWGALTRTWATAWRIASGVLLGLCVVVALVSSSVQGILAGAAGGVVLVVAWLLGRQERWARFALLSLAAASAALALVAIGGILTGVGPGDRLTSAGSLTARRWYWSSALRLWRQHPLTGVGLDRYGAYYRSVRPTEAAAVTNYSDAAHSVPLHLLATGGLLVALPYLALTLLLASLLVRALRRLQGEQRLLTGALGGSWVAYQVQSLVSIDQPGLAVTGWVLAGGLAAAASQPDRAYTRLLPGAVVPQQRKGRQSTVPAPRPVWSATTYGLGGLLVVLAGAAGWQAVQPLRASHASRAAAIQLVAGNGNAALQRMNTATTVAPYEEAFWLKRGKFLEQVKQPQLAMMDYRDGLLHDPRGYDLLVAAATLAKTQSDQTTLSFCRRQLALVDTSGRWRAAIGD